MREFLDTYHLFVIQVRCQNETFSEVLRYNMEYIISEDIADILTQRDSWYSQKTALFSPLCQFTPALWGKLFSCPLNELMHRPYDFVGHSQIIKKVSGYFLLKNTILFQ